MGTRGCGRYSYYDPSQARPRLHVDVACWTQIRTLLKPLLICFMRIPSRNSKLGE